MKEKIMQPWWKNAVVYQIYPRSFQDSNGDGIGDLRGILSRLDYLQELGINAIWLSPVYRSPQDDNGYDIADYQDIEPMFGTLDDIDELFAEAKKRGIRIMMDLVLNHTSDEHHWFCEARKSRDNPYHDYYVWRNGEADTPPNGMRGCFGGSAWEWVPEVEQFYFHQFSVRQPDLNWENPKVRRELYDMILWWMERGVGGFRLDVIDQIAKEPDKQITGNGPRLHEFLRELSRETFQKGDLITVGEAWGANPPIAQLYSNPDGSEFSMVFQFEHICLDQLPGQSKWDLAPLDFLKLKQVLGKWQDALHGCGWNSLFWNNHDTPRILSRWGDDRPQYRERCAKMLATLLHGMQGTPYVYQGEELGMTNVSYSIDDYRDIESLNIYKERLAAGYTEEDIMRSIHAKGRDNSRTPMQWDSGVNAGFTDGEPWLRVNPNFVEINARAQQENPDSVFHYYRRLIALRKELPVLVDGSYHPLLLDDPDIFAYTRELDNTQILVLCNFHDSITRYTLPEGYSEAGKMLISNEANPGQAGVLRPYEARIVLMESQKA